MPNANTLVLKHTCMHFYRSLARGLRDRRSEMMDVLYLLPPDSRSAEWTEGQRRPSVNTHFSPYFNFYVCVCVCQCTFWLLSCLCLWPWSSGGGLWASLSLPICPGTALSSLGLQHWQAELPRWWMNVRLVSVSESCTPATCRVGPCQRLPVGSAMLFSFSPPFFFIQLFIFILQLSHLSFI